MADILQKELDRCTKDKILQIHKSRGHRKDIMEDINSENIFMSKRILKEILEKCKNCMEYDLKSYRFGGFHKTNKVGELIGLAITDIGKMKAMFAVDCFSGKVYGILIKNKTKINIIRLLEEISKDMGIKGIITDNGKEFVNKDVGEWTRKRNIIHNKTVPYVHETNGRMEQVNKILKDMIKRMEGPVTKTFYEAIRIYNSKTHRGIGMSPIAAMKKENHIKVKENQDKYAEEFLGKMKVKKNIAIGDKVLVRNENKSSKIDREFRDEGAVEEILCDNEYLIKRKLGNKVKRHWLQLKVIKGM